MNILDLVIKAGIQPCKVSGTKGGEYHSPCPVCGGKDRFHVWPAQNNGQGSFWCRSCQIGGDMITYLRQVEGLSFPEAARIAGKDTGNGKYVRPVSIPGLRHVSRTTKPVIDATSVQDPDSAWQQKALHLMEQTNRSLLASSEPMSWLTKRGFTRQTVQRFQLGWIPEKTFRSRSSWGLPQVMSEKTGKPKLLWIPRGLVIPCFRAQRLVRIRIRRPEPDVDPRYYMLPGSATEPMPMFFAESTWTGRSQCLFICESELDAMLVAQEAGDLVQVLAVGSNSAKPRDELASNACARAVRIMLALDNDGAGDQAAKWWLENYTTARHLQHPQECKDPGEMIKAGHNIRQWILDALPNTWRIGMLAPELKNRGEAGPVEKRETGGGADQAEERKAIPVSVKRMGDLLKLSDVMLICSSQKLAIKPLHQKAGRWQEHHMWWHENQELSREIHDLFWYDDQVMEYLLQHPDKKITRRNYWKPLEKKSS